MLSNLAARVSEHPSCKYSARYHWPCPHSHHAKRARPQDAEPAESSEANDVLRAATLSVVYAAAVAGTSPGAARANKPLLASFNDDMVDVNELARNQGAQSRARGVSGEVAAVSSSSCVHCGCPHVLRASVGRSAAEETESQSTSAWRCHLNSSTSSQSHAITPTASGKSSVFPTSAEKSHTYVVESPGAGTVPPTAARAGPAVASPSSPVNAHSTSGRVIVKTRTDTRKHASTASTVDSVSVRSLSPVMVSMASEPSSRAVDTADRTPSTRTWRSAMYPASHYKALVASKKPASHHQTPSNAQSSDAPAVVVTGKGFLTLPHHPLHLTVPSHLHPATAQRQRPSGARSALRVVVRWSARNEDGGSDVTRIRATQPPSQRPAPAATSATTGGRDLGSTTASSHSEPLTALSLVAQRGATSRLVCLCCPHCGLTVDEPTEMWHGGRTVSSCASVGDDDSGMPSLAASQYQPPQAMTTPKLRHVIMTSPTVSVEGLGNHFNQSLSFTASSCTPSRVSEQYLRPQMPWSLQQQQQQQQRHAHPFAVVAPEKKGTNMSLSTQATSAAHDPGTATVTTLGGLSSSGIGTPVNSELLNASQITGPALTVSSVYAPQTQTHMVPSQQELFKAIVQRRKSSLRQDPANTAASPPPVTSTPLASSLAQSPNAALLTPDARSGGSAQFRGAGPAPTQALSGAVSTYNMSPISVAPYFASASVPPSRGGESAVFRQPSFRSSAGGMGPATTVATVGTASTTPETSVCDPMLAASGSSFPGYAHLFVPRLASGQTSARGGMPPPSPPPQPSVVTASGGLATYPWSDTSRPAAMADSLSLPAIVVTGSSNQPVADASLRMQMGSGDCDPLGSRLLRPSAATVAGASSCTTTPGAALVDDDDGGAGWLQPSLQSSGCWDRAVTPLLRPFKPNDAAGATRLLMPAAGPLGLNGGQPGEAYSHHASMHHLTLPPRPGTATPMGDATPYADRSPYAPAMSLPEGSGSLIPPSPAWTQPRVAGLAAVEESGAASAQSMPGAQSFSASVAAPSASTSLPAAAVTSPAVKLFCRYEVPGRRHHAAYGYAPTSAYCPGLHDRLAATRRLDVYRRRHADDHCYSLHNRGIVATTSSSPTASPAASVANNRVSQAEASRDDADTVDSTTPWYPFDDNYHRDGEMLEQLSVTTTSSCAFGAGLEGLNWRRWVAPETAASHDAHLTHVGDDDDEDNEDADDGGAQPGATRTADSVQTPAAGTVVSGAGSVDPKPHAHSRSTSDATASTHGGFCVCGSPHPHTPPVASPHEERTLSASIPGAGASSGSYVNHNPKVPLRAPPLPGSPPTVVSVPENITSGALSVDPAVAPRNWSESGSEAGEEDSGARRSEAAAAVSGRLKAAAQHARSATAESKLRGAETSSNAKHAREASASHSGSGGFSLFRGLRKGKKGAAEPGVILHSARSLSEEPRDARRRTAPAVVGATGPGGSTAPSTSAVGFLPFTNWLFTHMEERRARKEAKHARKQRAKELARVELWQKEKAEQQAGARRRRLTESMSAHPTMVVSAAPVGYRLGDAATMSPCSPRDMLSDSASGGVVGSEPVGVATRHRTAAAAGAPEVEGGQTSGAFAHSFPGVLVESTNTAATARARRALMTDVVMETFTGSDVTDSQEDTEAADGGQVAQPASAGTGRGRTAAATAPGPLSATGRSHTAAAPVCAQCHRPIRSSAAPMSVSTVVDSEDSHPERYLTGKPGGLLRACRGRCLAPRKKGKYNIQAQAPLTVAQLERHKALYAAEAAVMDAKSKAYKANTDGLRRLVKTNKPVMNAEAAALAGMWLHDPAHGVPDGAVKHWYEDDNEPAVVPGSRRDGAEAAASQNAAASSTSEPVGSTANPPASQESSESETATSTAQLNRLVAQAARTRESAEHAALVAANITLQRKRAAIESWLRHIE